MSDYDVHSSSRDKNKGEQLLWNVNHFYEMSDSLRSNNVWPSANKAYGTA